MRPAVIAPSSDRYFSLRQRWATYLTLVTALLMLLAGLNIRAGVLTAVTAFSDPRAGISVNYPSNWLLDTSDDYILRVRDMTQRGYKTTFQVSILPASPGINERNIADNLTRRRGQTFIAYTQQNAESIQLGDQEALAVTYTFVDQNPNPSLQQIPAVVFGLDIITISRDQVIVITYRADADVFEAERPRFDRFLNSLES